MNKFLITLIICCLAALCACSTDNRFRLEYTDRYIGKVDSAKSVINAMQIKNIYLATINSADIKNINIIDSAAVANGKFIIEGNVPKKKEIYYLLLKTEGHKTSEYQPIAFFIPEKGIIELTTLIIEDIGGISGTPLNDKLNQQMMDMHAAVKSDEFIEKMKEVSTWYSTVLDSINQSVDANKNPELYEQLRTEVESSMSKKHQDIMQSQRELGKDYMKEHINTSLVKGLLMTMICADQSQETSDMLLSIIPADIEDEDLAAIRKQAEIEQ